MVLLSLFALSSGPSRNIRGVTPNWLAKIFPIVLIIILVRIETAHNLSRLLIRLTFSVFNSEFPQSGQSSPLNPPLRGDLRGTVLHGLTPSITWIYYRPIPGICGVCPLCAVKLRGNAEGMDNRRTQRKPEYPVQGQ